MPADPIPKTVTPLTARKTWRTVEPLHGMIYFAPEAAASYTRLGLDPGAGYFASRSAAMGAVGADTVIATFFNFNPELVRAAIPAAWEVTSPAAVLEARVGAADAALTRMLGDAVTSTEMERAARLARRAAERAALRYEGRPLFAAHAGLAWPDAPHLVLWHAQTLLREFRGDGHITALVHADLDPVEALVMHLASGEVPGTFLRDSRGWPSPAWDAGVSRLIERDLVEVGRRTPRPERTRPLPAAGDRGRHRPAGRLPLRGPRRGGVRRAPLPDPPVQPWPWWRRQGWGADSRLPSGSVGPGPVTASANSGSWPGQGDHPVAEPIGQPGPIAAVDLLVAVEPVEDHHRRDRRHASRSPWPARPSTAGPR